MRNGARNLGSEFIPEDWARQCNMGAARGLSMSDVWATDGVVGRWKLFGLRIAEFITDV